MKCKLMGVEAREFDNPKTRQRGTEFLLQLHDGESVKTLRINEELFDKFRKLPAFADVEVKFGFVAGKFGQHFVSITDLTPVRVAA